MLLAPLNRTNDPASNCCAHAFFAKKYACGSNFSEFSEKLILTCVFFDFCTKKQLKSLLLFHDFVEKSMRVVLTFPNLAKINIDLCFFRFLHKKAIKIIVTFSRFSRKSMRVVLTFRI